MKYLWDFFKKWVTNFKDRFPLISRYGFAALLVSALLLIKMNVGYLSSGPPFILFFSAILGAAWFGGIGPAIFASAIGAFAANLFFMDSSFFSLNQLFITTTFIAEGILAAYVIRTHKKSSENLSKTEKEMAFRNLHDELTGLPNKKNFLALGQKMIDDNKETALFYLDLDRFREINETVGHANGDTLLKNISERLKKTAGEHSLVGRFGGDNFLVITPYHSEEETYEFAEDLLREIRKPIVLDNHSFKTSCSIGVAMHPQYAESIAALLKNSEIAMRQVKQAGGNNFLFYEPTQGLEYARKIYLAQELREGIDRKEFEMYFQPIFDIKNKKLIRAEALIRWNHPAEGLLYPGEFIPIAEETGSILALNEWVFENVCEQIREWETRELPPIRIAVNLSGKQFAEKNMVKKMERAIERTGVDPYLLEIEISESVALMNSDRNAAILNQIKKLGIQVSLDDFGTGYASLSYLTKFPIDTVKIDQTFIASAQKNLASKAIIKSIVILAYQLNLNYIVEGIENEEQLNFMRNLNCTWMQGFFLGKPLPKDEFEEILRNPELHYTLQDVGVTPRVS